MKKGLYLAWVFAVSAVLIMSAPGLLSGQKINLLKKEKVYGIVPVVKIHRLPSAKTTTVTTYRYGRWMKVLEEYGHWLLVSLPSGKKGYVQTKHVSDLWVKILKAERTLYLMKGGKKLQTMPVGLGFNPKDDKIKLGDGCTPEGRFYICEVRRFKPASGTYGPVSLRISYPNIEDARRALRTKLITKAQYLSIVKGINKGVMPNQRTPLGGSIKIHGGTPGASSDWTLGCIAVSDEHMKEIFAFLPSKLGMVEIYSSRAQERKLNRAGYVNQEIIKTSAKLIKKGCLYTGKATGIIPLKYPMGDLDPKQGVCTDVAIRALRGINIDLQALVYEDIWLNPRRYKKIRKPNPNIDHRRTRNLKIFFDHNAIVLTNEPPVVKPSQWKPGDIVLMDTGISNGTIYDHIGIVSKNKNAEGIPLVINLWTVGMKLNEMELLDGAYPKIVGHYRLIHPFFYDALP